MPARNSSQKPVENAATQRIDKWLWFARLVKTRTMASRLVSSGKIRINREKIDKPSQNVKELDVITARIGRRILVLKVLDTGQRRGPSAEALALYEDITPPDEALRKVTGPGQKKLKIGALSSGRVAERRQGSGRPTKRDRRKIDRFRDNEN